ncbi:MAG: 4Fe-4S binding protein [Chloroflexota bacterium]
MNDAELRIAFIRQFHVPEAGVPYLDTMLSRQEMRLVVAAGDASLDVPTAAAALGLTLAEAGTLLDSAFRRGIVEREEQDGVHRYAPTSFYTRMDVFATFENWTDLPADVRLALDDWMLGEYLARVRPNVERMRAGLPSLKSPGNDSVLLVTEVDAVVDAARTIAVLPCNCRRIGRRCEKPVETCIQFDAVAEHQLARGHGRRLTPAEAKALVRAADRAGLMHTTDLNWGESGPAPVCNCCGDDCYVFRGAALLDSKGVWPHSRYVATFDGDKCNQCGACVRRCHFAAFYHPAEGTAAAPGRKQPVAFAAELCWGCGLCANSCPTGAIQMIRVAGDRGGR